jgi:hypothetical protein
MGRVVGCYDTVQMAKYLAIYMPWAYRKMVIDRCQNHN